MVARAAVLASKRLIAMVSKINYYVKNNNLSEI